MTDTLKRIFGPVQIGSGNTVIFTGTGGTVYTIRNLRIVNPSSVLTINLKLGIGGIADSNLILPTVAFGPLESASADELYILTGAETFEANADQAGLVITADGVQQT